MPAAVTVTVKAPIVTSSALVGTAAPPQVVVKFQLPDADAVLVAANISLLDKKIQTVKIEIVNCCNIFMQ